MSNRLIIGISHYCEKSRWALERAGISQEFRSMNEGKRVLRLYQQFRSSKPESGASQ